MPVPNLGQFASQDPQAQQAIQAAIQARNQGGQVPQVAQSGQQPPGQVPQPAQGPQGQPQLPGQPAPGPQPSESELIVKGLNQRLSSISAIEKAQNPPPQQAPVGGGGLQQPTPSPR